MKVVIDEKLAGKDLYSFLIENKSQLIAQKKSMPITSDGVKGYPSLFDLKDGTANKTAVGDISDKATMVRVKLVANTAYWQDSQDDVLLPDCWAKSIRDGKGRVHLVDHTYKLNAEVGDVTNVYSQQMSLTEFGLTKTGTTQSLIYESDVQKLYDEATFNKYRKGKVKQHSIGLQYVKIVLAVNDEEYKEEYAEWLKHIDKIINKEHAENRGYFFAVYEIKLIEVSAVLFGSNELTPLLEVKSDTFNQPPQGTDDEPPHEKSFNWTKAIQETKFIKL